MDDKLPTPRAIDPWLEMARAHGETTDTKMWTGDLEDMLRIAWDIMTDEQRDAFSTHPDVLAIAEASGV